MTGISRNIEAHQLKTIDCERCTPEKRSHGLGVYTIGILEGVDKVVLAVECPNGHKFTPTGEEQHMLLGQDGVGVAVEGMLYAVSCRRSRTQG